MVIGEDIQQEMLASLQPNLINHSQITRVTLFIKLFLVCLLSPQQRWCFNGLKGKWEWIETWVRVEWGTKIWASNWIIEKKVKVNWTLRQTCVRHMFTWRPAGSCTHRRQNGTILGKFRWKTKTSCFDAKLVLTQPASASVEVSWRREGSRLKTSCFAQRKSTITTAALCEQSRLLDNLVLIENHREIFRLNNAAIFLYLQTVKCHQNRVQLE